MENILTRIIHIAKVWFLWWFLVIHVDKDLQKSGHIHSKPSWLSGGIKSSWSSFIMKISLHGDWKDVGESSLSITRQIFLKIMTKHSAAQLCVIGFAIFEPTVTKPQESQDGSCQVWNLEIQLVDFMFHCFEAQPWPNLELSNCASSPAAPDLKKKCEFDGCSCMFLASWILMRFHSSNGIKQVNRLRPRHFRTPSHPSISNWKGIAPASCHAHQGCPPTDKSRKINKQ